MNRDDLRLDIKFMMANNLIEIINLRDEKNICSRELSLTVDYEIYDKIIEILNNKGFSIDEMEGLLESLRNDSKYLNYTTPVGFVIYLVCIFVFGFFYTFLQVNPEELSKNLNRQGGYIPGIRPGKETKNYIKTVLGRITLLGTTFIAIIAALPIIFSSFMTTNLPSSVSIGGTGLLIVVGVALETYKQLESSLINRNYKGVR